MLDYQRIVDDVRNLIGSQNAEDIDFLRATAADYAVACDEVNGRLSQCGALLRQGLRSEAIQLCEIEPNLLDLVALLDFPERLAWTDTANRCGIAPPPALLVDVAGALNEAYALEQPVAALLQKHRLLALSHGSLSARIEVLRQLAERDVNNAVWQEDLELFEKERQKQIPAEVEAAIRAGDLTTLTALDTELFDPGWRNAVPQELTKSVGEALAGVRCRAVQSQFEHLAEELVEAMSGNQVELGRTLRDRWNEIVATSGWQPRGPIADRAAPALNWLSKQDEIEQRRAEYETAIDALAQATRNGRSALQLEALHRRAAGFGTLPGELEEDYRSRLALLQRAARRRRWLQLTGVIVGVLVVVVVTGMTLSHEHYERQVAKFVESLTPMLEHDRLEEAQALVSSEPERIRQDPRAQELIVRFQDKRKREPTRRAEFSRELTTSNECLKQVQKALVKEQGQTDLDRLQPDLHSIEEHLQRAHGLARTDEEQAGISKATESLSRVKDEWQNQCDNVFLGQYEDFTRQLTRIEGHEQTGSGAQERTLSDLRERLRKWENASGHVSAPLLSRIQTLKKRLSDLEKGLQQQEQEDRERRQITAAVGDIRNYVKALQNCIQHNLRPDCTSDFRRAIEESPCWESVAEWNGLAEQLQRAGVMGLRPAAAERQLALVNAVSEKFADCPECASLRQLLPHLKAIAARDNGGERIEVTLKKLFADPLVANVWMVEKQGGQRYYLKSQLGTAGFPMSFSYFATFDGKTKGGVMTQAEFKSTGRAPQVSVAEQVQPILNALDDGNWEKSFCQVIAVILEDHDVDPILKLNLLQQVLEIGTRGSYCLEKAFGKDLNGVKDAKVNTFANWLDSTDPAAADARGEAAKQLGRFGNGTKQTKDAKQDLEDLRRRRIPEYRWVGWLHLTRDGRWECMLNQTRGETGRLLVVYRQSLDAKLLLRPVGRLDHKMPSVDPTVRSVLVQGRPVYLEVP
jgi:hypothetical protein